MCLCIVFGILSYYYKVDFFCFLFYSSYSDSFFVSFIWHELLFSLFSDYYYYWRFTISHMFNAQIEVLFSIVSTFLRFTIYDFLLVYKSSMLVYFHEFLVYKNVYCIFIFKISFKYIKVRCWDYSPNSFFCWCIFNIFLYIKMCTLFNINHLYLKKKKTKKITKFI